MKMLKTLIATAILASATSAMAAPIYTVDELIGQSDLPNSGKDTVLKELDKYVAGDLVKTPYDKLEGKEFSAQLDGAGNWFIDVGDANPTYFALKFGTGSTIVKNDFYFFKNVGELDKLVFTNQQVNFLTGGGICGKPSGKPGKPGYKDGSENCNIDRLSHVTLVGYTPPPKGEVPEPASLALLGLGLAGVAGVSRRRKAK